MSIAEILKRTAARKAAGINQVYPEHAGKAQQASAPKSAALKTVSLPVVLSPCVHEGNVLETCHTCAGKDESRHVRECELHGKCTRSHVSAKVRACTMCADYQPE